MLCIFDAPSVKGELSYSTGIFIWELYQPLFVAVCQRNRSTLDCFRWCSILHIHTRTHAHTYRCVCVCARARVHAYLLACVFVHLYIYMHACVYIYAYISNIYKTYTHTNRFCISSSPEHLHELYLGRPASLDPSPRVSSLDGPSSNLKLRRM